MAPEKSGELIGTERQKPVKGQPNVDHVTEPSIEQHPDHGSSVAKV